jgi:hypothetical protein
MAARKRSKARSKSPARGRSARRAPARKPAAKRAKRPARAKPRANPLAALQALARKLVKATSSPGFPFHTLYADNARSVEGTGQVYTGRAELEQKLQGWEQMQSGTTWKARNVWADPRSKTICIEWDAVVNLRDGRVVNLAEVAVHRVEGGKIVDERYYYNPMALMPPQTQA